MIRLNAFVNRFRAPGVRRTTGRSLRSSHMCFERYGIDLLERRQMLAVSPASDFTYNMANGQVAITGYVGSASAVEIPATINSLPVTSIGQAAFQGKGVTSVAIPSGVTTIGQESFSGCQKLASITIPASVTDIGAGAFSLCTSLTTVMIPASVTRIGNNPFRECTALTGIAVSPDNPAYGSRDGVLYTKDGTVLLSYPAGRQGDFAIPTGVTVVGWQAFDSCYGLTGVSIPDSVTQIDYCAFWYCLGLTSVYVPDSVQSMEGAFGSCENLRSVRLPSNLTELSGWLFLGCEKLTDVTIPASVTVVHAGAFKECKSLSSIQIPAGVTDIGWEAFSGCTSLTSISLPEGVKAIPADAFLFCSQLKDITIPASVTSIGSRAFQSCESIASIVIPAGVTSMGDEVFKGCTSLTVVRMQGSPPTIGTAVFGGVNPSQAAAYYPAGTNGWSDTFGGLPTRPYAPPGAPSALIAGRGNGQVQLSWTTPETDGGFPIEDYRIQYSTDGATSWQTVNRNASTATSATVTGLTNGIGYVFRVASMTDVGAGSYSANSSVVTPATTPNAPAAVAGVRGNGQVQLSWSAPVFNGGLSLDDYRIQYSTDGVEWQTVNRSASTATSTTVTGLTNGTGYLFRVAAVNAIGTGSYATTVGKITPGFVAPPPDNLIATRGNGVVKLTWTAPASSVGVTIGDYAVQYSTDGGLSWRVVRDGVSTATRAVVSGLVPGRDHIFRVASVSRSGTGDFSPPSGSVRPATLPTAPLRVVATGGAGQVVLSWNAPASNGGSLVKQYIVQSSPSAGRWLTSTTVGSNTTTATVGGLLANRSYSFRVLAVNDIGNSPASRVVAARTLRASPALA